MVRDFCFWAVWAAGPVLKKKLGANYEQLLREVFSCFRGKKYNENTTASVLRNWIIIQFGKIIGI